MQAHFYPKPYQVDIFSRNSSFLHTESPVWDEAGQRLLFVDIASRMLLEVDRRRHCTVQEHGVDITSVNLTMSGGYILGGDESIRLLGGARLPIPLRTRGRSRLNDARVDAAGRLWLTSMDREEVNPTGVLICLYPNAEQETKFCELIVGNGLGWNRDGTLMYITDSKSGKIYCYDFNIRLAELANRRIFADVPRSTGLPDGLAVDSEDCVWSAHFGGRRITRYLPTGKIDFYIELPVNSPTSICFGGPHFSTLFITSSTLGTQDSTELDGSVLSIDTEFFGSKTNRFDDSKFLICGND